MGKSRTGLNSRPTKLPTEVPTKTSIENPTKMPTKVCTEMPNKMSLELPPPSRCPFRCPPPPKACQVEGVS